MNTIKIPVKVTTVEESSIEIETPCYTRVETHVYRISGKDNRKDCIQVFCAPSYEEGTSIACSYFDLAFSAGHVFITKEEYEQQFNKALAILKGEQL